MLEHEPIQPPDPSAGGNAEPDLTAAVLEQNLQNVTGFAKHLGSSDFPGFSSLSFINSTGDNPWELANDCDAINRTMLDKLYSLSHVDADATLTVERGDQNEGRYDRMTIIPTSHGFHFMERYAKDGNGWEIFKATYSGGDGSIDLEIFTV